MFTGIECVVYLNLNLFFLLKTALSHTGFTFCWTLGLILSSNDEQASTCWKSAAWLCPVSCRKERLSALPSFSFNDSSLSPLTCITSAQMESDDLHHHQLSPDDGAVWRRQQHPLISLTTSSNTPPLCSLWFSVDNVDHASPPSPPPLEPRSWEGFSRVGSTGSACLHLSSCAGNLDVF